MPNTENDAQVHGDFDSFDDWDDVEKLNAIYAPSKFTPLSRRGTQSVGVYRVDTYLNGRHDVAVAKIFYETAIDEVVRKELRGWQNMPSHEAIIQYRGLDMKFKNYVVLFMEFFPGKEIDQFVYDLCDGGKKADRMTFIEYRKILDIILRGFQHAHNHEVIHLDIKPDNLLVSKVKGSMDFLAKIIDFGIAQLKGEDFSSTKGAQGYHAPETRTTTPDNPAKAMPSADLFSLGVVADQMFSGDMARRLWTLPKEIAEKRPGKAEITKQELDDIVVNLCKPERYVAGCKATQECAAVIAKSIAKCLQFVPSSRYQSAEAFRIDLNLSSELGAVKTLNQLTKEATTPDGMEKLLKQYESVRKLAGTTSPKYFHDTMLAEAVKSFRARRTEILKNVYVYAYLRQSEKYKQTPYEQKKIIEDLLDVKIDCADEEDQKKIEKYKKEAFDIMTAVARQTPRPTINETDTVAMIAWKGFFNKLACGELSELQEMWLM